MKTLDQIRLDTIRRVKSIYMALLSQGPPSIAPSIAPSIEEQAEQCHACLIAAAGIHLKISGWRPWSPGGDELAIRMAIAAADAMGQAQAAWKAEQN